MATANRDFIPPSFRKALDQIEAKIKPTVGIHLDAGNQSAVVASIVHGVLEVLGAEQDQATLQAALTVFAKLAEKATIEHITIRDTVIDQHPR